MFNSFSPQYLCGFLPVFNTQVRYKLDKEPNALVLQILDQSPDITAFLNGNTFMSPTTGLKVMTSNYPEFKHSKNVIFLRGSDKSNDFKPDVTRFVGKMQRDNAYEMVVQTIQELVDFVKEASTATPVNVYGSYQAKPVKVRSHYRSAPSYRSNCVSGAPVIIIR